jgi:hypothetical protein
VPAAPVDLFVGGSPPGLDKWTDDASLDPEIPPFQGRPLPEVAQVAHDDGPPDLPIQPGGPIPPPLLITHSSEQAERISANAASQRIALAPEPSTGLLLAMGLAVLARLRTRA